MKILLPSLMFVLLAFTLPYQAEAARDINVGKTEASNKPRYNKDNVREYEQDDVSIIANAYYENDTNLLANGIVKSYYPEGKIKREERIKEGKLNGVSKMYYPNGKLLLSITFENNKANGPYDIYYTNSRSKLSGNYANNKKDGEFKKYDEKGKLLYIISFRKDVVSSGKKYNKKGEEEPLSLDELEDIVPTLLE